MYPFQLMVLGYFPFFPAGPPPVFKPQITMRFDGNPDEVASFLVATEQFLNRWGYQFADEGDVVEYIAGQLNGAALKWYVNLFQSGAPELYSLPTFLCAMEVHFGEPALIENARTDLKNLKQGDHCQPPRLA